MTWRDRSSLGVLAIACACAAGCTAKASQTEPPKTQIFYPTGLAVTPDESMLFVASANSELRYDSGSLDVIDLSIVDQVIAGWTGNGNMPSGCSPDATFSETLVCDEAQFIVKDAGVRIGNFATDIAVQDRGGGNLRLIVPTRGDPSVEWIDWDGSKLSCSKPTQGFPLCDDNHRLTYIQNDPSLAALPDEPFGVFADSVGNYAVVTHLTSGAVTLIDSPPDGPATIADVQTGLFSADPVTGVIGATGVAGRSPGAGDILYVGSRSEDRIQTLTVARPVNGAPPYLIPGNWFFLDYVGDGAGASSDTRGMTFSPSGDRLYVVNRDPPSLQVVDTSLGATGFPSNKVIAATDLCRDASEVAAVDTGDGERVYTTCFDDGEVYVIDPRGLSSVVDIISVGHGPYAVVAAPNRKRLYVSNFLEDTISVIDIDPSSPMRDRVVLRIGLPVDHSTSSTSSSS